jgi:hypothetical protein
MRLLITYRGLGWRFAFGAIVLASLTSAAASQDLTAEHTLQTLESATHAIRSFDVKFDITIRGYFTGQPRDNVKDNRHGGQGTLQKLDDSEVRIIRSQYRQVFQEGKGRAEYYPQDNPDLANLVVYDLESEKVYSPKLGHASIRNRHNQLANDGCDYLETFRTIWGPVDLAKSLRARTNVKVTQLLDPLLISLESDPCLTPDVSPDVDFPDRGCRLIIDPKNAFLPKTFEWFKPLGGRKITLLRRQVQEWKAIGKGLWAPIRMITYQYASDASDAAALGQVVTETEMKLRVSESSWNKEIPEDRFRLPLPSGVTVTDLRRQLQYVTGASDPGKNLDDLIKHARSVTEATPMEPPTPEGWLNRRVLLLGLLILMALGGIVFVVLRRGRMIVERN